MEASTTISQLSVKQKYDKSVRQRWVIDATG